MGEGHALSPSGDRYGGLRACSLAGVERGKGALWPPLPTLPPEGERTLSFIPACARLPVPVKAAAVFMTEGRGFVDLAPYRAPLRNLVASLVVPPVAFFVFFFY